MVVQINDKNEMLRAIAKELIQLQQPASTLPANSSRPSGIKPLIVAGFLKATDLRDIGYFGMMFLYRCYTIA
jgi:hypothetical protein